MKVCIVTDDNACFSRKEIANKDIYVIKMPVVINGEDFFENENLTTDEFYKKLANGDDIRTSQPSPGQIINLWDELLKKYDAILHIPMSSGLSNSYQTAEMLAQDYKNKVFVVNNHRISVTLKSSVRDAKKLLDQGIQPAYVKSYLEAEALNSSIYIMVDTLKYLKKGGRITPAGAMIGEALHIKPVLAINGEKLDAFKKAIGSKKAKIIMIEAIQEDLKTKFKDFENDELVFQMAYTYNLEEALAFRKEYAKALNINEKQIELDPLSLSVATHIGPGSLALTCSHVIKNKK